MPGKEVTESAFRIRLPFESGYLSVEKFNSINEYPA